MLKPKHMPNLMHSLFHNSFLQKPERWSLTVEFCAKAVNRNNRCAHSSLFQPENKIQSIVIQILIAHKKRRNIFFYCCSDASSCKHFQNFFRIILPSHCIESLLRLFSCWLNFILEVQKIRKIILKNKI